MTGIRAKRRRRIARPRQSIQMTPRSGLRWRTGRIISLMIGAIIAGGPIPRLQAQGADEFQVKAAFVFNFLKFVEWPAAAFSSEDSPFLIGIMGSDPIAAAVDRAFQGKS